MRVIVDTDRCEGHGMCEDAAPLVFALDDDGELHVRVDTVPPSLELAAARAVRLCPVVALTLQP